MANKYVMALDVGTSRIRCLIVDLKGHPVALSSREMAYEIPEDSAPLGKEICPTTFWKLLCEIIGDALNKASIRREDISGVSATSQRGGIVLLDKRGKELYAGPSLDLRAFLEGLTIDEEHGQEVYSITGHLPSFFFAPAKLRWLQKSRPEAFNRAATVLTLGEWILYKLSGEVASDRSAAGEAGLLDIGKNCRNCSLFSLLGLPDNLFPPLGNSGDAVGSVTKEAASHTGLREGTPVVIGGADTQCGLLGMGAIRQAQVGILAGWSAPVQMVTSRPILDKASRTWTGCHLMPGRWILESNTTEAGHALQWLVEMMTGNACDESYSIAGQWAQATESYDDAVFAFLGPRVMDAKSLGVRLGGFLFPVPLTAGYIEKGQLIRAAYMNLAFAIKGNCQQLEEVSGLKIREVSLGGGLSRNSFFNQIVADVLGIPINISKISEVSALGCALCAAAGSGAYASLEEAVDAMGAPMQKLEHQELNHARYQDTYQQWLSISRELDKLTNQLK